MPSTAKESAGVVLGVVGDDAGLDSKEWRTLQKRIASRRNTYKVEGSGFAFADNNGNQVVELVAKL